LLDFDPFSMFIAATVMMLLNGAVLGFMHKSLAADVRSSAADWRIGTLLLACGGLLLTVQQATQQPLAHWLIYPLGNGYIFVGLTLYLRAVRRFQAAPDTPWLFLPALIGTAAIYWFSVFAPSFAGRVVISTLLFSSCTGMSAYYLWRQSTTRGNVNPIEPRESLTSHRVLAATFLLVSLGMLLRGSYLTFFFDHLHQQSQVRQFVPILASLSAVMLPIIGTTAFLVMCSDRLRGQWERAAVTDVLTGLSNRLGIFGAAETRFEAARRTGSGMAVAVVDVDHFKAINDRFGHDGGDKVLKLVALALTQATRATDHAGRQGGEEFMVLLDGATVSTSLSVAERLRSSVAQCQVELNGAPVGVTVSIGVANMLPADRHFNDMLRRADTALYAAKAGGRNRVELAAVC
jgi:diguanylate cyclase (GGDEF)-like protein